MTNLGYTLLAFLIASGITLLELVTTKYPRTFFVLTLRRCPALYIYSLIYGLVASMIVYLGILHLEKIGLANQWLQAVFVGLSIKAFLHIRFFSVPASTDVGTEPIPIGFETLVRIFEPQLLKQIELNEFNATRIFLIQRAEKYPDTDKVRRLIMQNLPRNLSRDGRIAFEEDLKLALQNDTDDRDTITRVADAMERYLNLMGRQSLDRIFPLNPLDPISSLESSHSS